MSGFYPGYWDEHHREAPSESMSAQEAREALTDAPEKLAIIAAWHDSNDRATGKTGTEVQDDLRKWARAISVLRSQAIPQETKP